MQLVERLLNAKRKQEETTNEVALLKQRVANNRPPASFNGLEIALPLSFHSIRDETVRSRLGERYRKTIQQSKANLIAVFVEIAEAQMHQSQKEFDHQMNQLWHQYRSTEMDQPNSEAVINLIDQRLVNIIKRMQCTYQYQVNFFVSAPTTTNI